MENSYWCLPKYSQYNRVSFHYLLHDLGFFQTLGLPWLEFCNFSLEDIIIPIS